ncbi:uncharacterized protein [Primulina huaijiensis]|uniref:uncharacterized protein n=1 Tax=Primulina huaijiensis TaxID=1492673 RepID=UPI003CC6F8DC
MGLSTLIMIRLLYVIYLSDHPLYCRPPGPLSAIIVLASGDQTAEMLNLLAALQIDRFKPRYYIAAATDNMSPEKAQVLENSLLETILCNGPGTCIPLCVIAVLFKVFGI